MTDWIDDHIRRASNGEALQPTGVYRKKQGAHMALILRDAAAVMRRRPPSRMAQHLGIPKPDYTTEPTVEETQAALQAFEQANGFETEFSYS